MVYSLAAKGSFYCHLEPGKFSASKFPCTMLLDIWKNEGGGCSATDLTKYFTAITAFKKLAIMNNCTLNSEQISFLCIFPGFFFKSVKVPKNQRGNHSVKKRKGNRFLSVIFVDVLETRIIKAKWM